MPGILTAATDGTTVYCNRHFLYGLSTEERRFVLAHGVWHCEALYPLRRGERHPVLRTGESVIEHAGFYSEHRRFRAEAIYEELRRHRRGRFADVHEIPGIDPTEQR